MPRFNDLDYEDPAVEEAWCEGRREEVCQYLKVQGVEHGEVGEWPAWHVPPYASVWAIESRQAPGWVGWWVICGDLPTDYVSAATIKHPREALRAFAETWRMWCECMKRGEAPPGVSLGTPDAWPALAPLLAARAELLEEAAGDTSQWEEDE